jgi:hypothetical protein
MPSATPVPDPSARPTTRTRRHWSPDGSDQSLRGSASPTGRDGKDVGFADVERRDWRLRAGSRFKGKADGRDPGVAADLVERLSVMPAGRRAVQSTPSEKLTV